MSNPPTARQTPSGRRYGPFQWESEERWPWSVTTILNVLAKPVLIKWAAKEVAQYAVAHIDEVASLASSDPDGAVELLKGAPYRARDKKADLGSLLHKVAEAHVLGTPAPPIPPVLERKAYALRKFIEDWSPEFQASEMTVVNWTYDWAGTLDAIATINDSVLLLDYTTAKGVYPEKAIQLTAYRNAEYALAPNGEFLPMPKTDGGAVVHLTDEGYFLRPVRSDQALWDCFRYIREMFQFQEGLADSVIGEAVLPSVAPFLPELVTP